MSFGDGRTTISLSYCYLFPVGWRRDKSRSAQFYRSWPCVKDAQGGDRREPVRSTGAKRTPQQPDPLPRALALCACKGKGTRHYQKQMIR
ncbi:MAG: hypothetical protein QM727_08445 [Niabella sp.]